MDIVTVPISKGFYSNQTAEEYELCINHMEKRVTEWGLIRIHDFNDGESHHLRVYARPDIAYQLDWNHGQILAKTEDGKTIEVEWYPDIFEPLRPAWKKAGEVMQRKIFPKEIFIGDGILSFTGEVLATLAEFESADKSQDIFEDLHWFDIIVVQDGAYELKGKELIPQFIEKQWEVYYDVLDAKVKAFLDASSEVKLFVGRALIRTQDGDYISWDAKPRQGKRLGLTIKAYKHNQKYSPFAVIIRQKPIGASDYDKFDLLYEQAGIPTIEQVFIEIDAFINQFNLL
jgi:hypothetical protein